MSAGEHTIRILLMKLVLRCSRGFDWVWKSERLPGSAFVVKLPAMGGGEGNPYVKQQDECVE